METPQVSFKQVVSRGCGLDVHKKTVVATINGEGLKKQTREFGTVTTSIFRTIRIRRNLSEENLPAFKS